MSAGPFEEQPITEHKDSVLYMMLRRIINGQYAEDKIEFNEAGLIAGQRVVGRDFTPDDTIVDIGSSSGIMMAEAAMATGTAARIVCVEPDEEASETYSRLPYEQQQRVHYARAIGEALPFRDSSLQGVTLHNVIFRARDSKAMVAEAKRVTVPGGFIAISSNAQGHAFYRHTFESFVAEKVALITSLDIVSPTPPAEGHYLEDLPKLIGGVGDLEIRDDLYVSQDTQAVITRGKRLENYLDSIKFSAANTDVPDIHHLTWRNVVDFWIKPFIEAEIDKADHTFKKHGIVKEPFFADPIQRGMFVLQNKKHN